MTFYTPPKQTPAPSRKKNLAHAKRDGGLVGTSLVVLIIGVIMVTTTSAGNALCNSGLGVLVQQTKSGMVHCGMDTAVHSFGTVLIVMGSIGLGLCIIILGWVAYAAIQQKSQQTDQEKGAS